MPGLKITSLGDLRIELDGEPASGFDTDKTRALLVFLAVENARPQRRTYLAGLLWSDQSEEQALHGLRQALSSLRKVLGDSSAPLPFLLANRDSIQINPEIPLRVDILAFHQKLQSAYRYYERRDRGGWLNIRSLQQAAALYQGPFLDHFDLKGSPLFDEWAALIREENNRRATEAFALLAEYHERRGEYAQARKMIEQVLKIAPWDETAHIHLMRLLALDQQWSAAHHQFVTMRRYLDEHLGLELSPESRVLFEQIRAAASKNSGFPARFPPVHAELPAPEPPLIGRQKELDEITDLLVDPACRLVTLLGPGGVGKTRLAVEAARQQVGVFTDGVYFVPLVSVSSGEQVDAFIADALGLVLTGQSDPHARLIDYLREKRLLLVLDNYEQLLSAGEGALPLAKILASASGTILLVTSRERLLLKEEWVYPLTGLRYPQSAPGAQDLPSGWLVCFDALELFYRRARQSQHSFTLDSATLAAVVRICTLLEGLPLGIELAAGAVWNQSCDAVAEQIDMHLGSLVASANNPLPRHRSLWAAFDVSWHLLTPAEQAVIRRLSVFRGGFPQGAAQHVAQASPDLLTALVNQSLLQVHPGGRYDFHEAVRQYANEKLVLAGDLADYRAAHARFYCTFLANLSTTLEGEGQKQSLTALQMELGNAKAAWEWWVENCQIDEILTCLLPLYQFFNVRSRFTEGIQCFQRAVSGLQALIQTGTNPAAQQAYGMVIARIGSLAYYARQNALALEMLEQAQNIFTRLNDLAELAFCRTTLGGVYQRRKDFARAQTCAEQNLVYYRQVGNALGETRALYLLGLIHNRLAKFARVRDSIYSRPLMPESIPETRDG